MSKRHHPYIGTTSKGYSARAGLHQRGGTQTPTSTFTDQVHPSLLQKVVPISWNVSRNERSVVTNGICTAQATLEHLEQQLSLANSFRAARLGQLHRLFPTAQGDISGPSRYDETIPLQQDTEFARHTLQVKHLQDSIATVRDVLATYGGYLYRIDTFEVDDWARPVDTSSHIHRPFIVNNDDLGYAAVALQATFDGHNLHTKNQMANGEAANAANATFNEHYGVNCCLTNCLE
ncbi:hypothetical protein BGX24_002267 [Mortierella sp. AD032]|nr:hypothetical protein BGX24_002267 [Mortierella sp. AD032]